MNALRPDTHPGTTAAIVWVALWAAVLAAIGVNHLAKQRPGGGTLLLVAGVVAAFLGTLWLVSLQPRSGAAQAANVVLLGALVVSAVLLSRRPAFIALHWSKPGHDLALVVSWVWVALAWVSVLGAAALAEVHHVRHSRAR